MKITIQSTDGPKKIEAEKAGKLFAVHPTYKWRLHKGRWCRWTLTHIPSGYTLVKYENKSLLKKVARGVEKKWFKNLEKLTAEEAEKYKNETWTHQMLAYIEGIKL